MTQLVHIIDDDEWLAQQFERILQQAGYKVTKSTSAAQAIDIVDKALPDCIILDLFLPGQNGIALLHEMQSYSDLSKIPVLLCTNNAAEVPENLVKPYGVMTVLDKTTLSPASLIAAIKKALL